MILKNMRRSTKNKLLITHLSVNSIRNKVKALKCVGFRNIDVLASMAICYPYEQMGISIGEVFDYILEMVFLLEKLQ